MGLRVVEKRCEIVLNVQRVGSRAVCFEPSTLKPAVVAVWILRYAGEYCCVSTNAFIACWPWSVEIFQNRTPRIQKHGLVWVCWSDH